MQIFNKGFRVLCFGAIAPLFSYSCGDDGSSKSIEVDELNPPGNLYSVTQDKSVELRWTAGNTEEDFKGYQVFGAKVNLDDLVETIKFPANASAGLASGAIIPRCADNNAFFKAFGFAESSVVCSDGSEESDPTDDNEAGGGADGEETGDEGAALTNFLGCEGQTAAGATASLSLLPPALDLQRCVVTKAWDAETGALVDIENGNDYVFFVVAVMGDDMNQISWTSNIIEDVPSVDAYDDAIKIAAETYVVLTIDEDFAGDLLTPTIKVSAAKTCPETIPCRLGTGNAAADDGIYLARDSGTLYPQRLFISTKTGGSFQLQQHRTVRDSGAEDQDSSMIWVRTPGDMAIDKTTYPETGDSFTLRDGQVYDFTYTASNSKTYYGKIVIPTLTYASSTTSSEATIQVNVVMQIKPDERNYFN